MPLLHTPDAVLSKMRGGADLMTPGLAFGPPFPTKATKGSLVAVAATERPSVPLVVGSCEINISALTEVRGAKGHAVRSLHWLGDELWSWGSGLKSGADAPEHIDGWSSGFNENHALLEVDVTRMTISDSGNTSSHPVGQIDDPVDGQKGEGGSGDGLIDRDEPSRREERSTKGASSFPSQCRAKD
jgi:translation initiation factor 2D